MPKPIVYFAGAIRGDRIFAKTLRELVAYIQSIGYEVLTEHVGKRHPIAYLAHRLHTKGGELKAEDIEKQDIAWLDRATHVIAEISGASTGTGREIEYARTKNIFGKTAAKILCLYRQDREYYASPMIRGLTPERYKNVQVRSYNSVDGAKAIIKNFLES